MWSRNKQTMVIDLIRYAFFIVQYPLCHCNPRPNFIQSVIIVICTPWHHSRISNVKVLFEFVIPGCCHHTRYPRHTKSWITRPISYDTIPVAIARNFKAYHRPECELSWMKPCWHLKVDCHSVMISTCQQSTFLILCNCIHKLRCQSLLKLYILKKTSLDPNAAIYVPKHFMFTPMKCRQLHFMYY